MQNYFNFHAVLYSFSLKAVIMQRTMLFQSKKFEKGQDQAIKIII